jgi:hypothetical protein
MKHIGHPKNHMINVIEASSLNNALTNSTDIKMPTVTSMPVAKDARRSFIGAVLALRHTSLSQMKNGRLFNLP